MRPTVLLEVATRIALNGLLALLSYVVPKNPRSIVIGSHFGRSFLGNSKYFYLYLLGLEECVFTSVVWVTNSRELYAEMQRNNLPVLRLNTVVGFVSVLRARYLVGTYNTQDFSYFQVLPGRFKKIQTYHGLPLKGRIPDLDKIRPAPIGFYLFRKERESYAAFITTSDETRRLEKRFMYKRIEVLGYPRNDLFFDRRMQFHNYVKELHLNQYSKTLLYCPTFRDSVRPFTPLSAQFLRELDDYLQSSNMVLLVTSHPNGGLRIELADYRNILDVSPSVSDIQDLLRDVDLLISDYSSVTLDFLLTGRPIVFFPYDYEDYVRRREFLIEYYADLPGPFPRSEPELLECLKSVDVWAQDPGYRRRYDHLKQRFHKYQDGLSSRRLHEFLAQCID